MEKFVLPQNDVQGVIKIQMVKGERRGSTEFHSCTEFETLGWRGTTKLNVLGLGQCRVG